MIRMFSLSALLLLAACGGADGYRIGEEKMRLRSGVLRIVGAMDADGMARFDLSSVPAGAAIHSAILMQQEASGTVHPMGPAGSAGSQDLTDQVRADLSSGRTAIHLHGDHLAPGARPVLEIVHGI